MNSIAIHGRLTRDPETRQTASGVSVTNFTVAVDRDYKDQNGEKQTDFFDCTAWKGRGEVIAKYFQKGSDICVTGSMESRKYEDKEGNNRIAWGINVQGFDFCGSKGDKASGGAAGGYQSEPSQGFSELSGDDGGDGLPF
jgi:single-strand DNA-binding protein